jgi:hypothetical protein
MKSYDIEYSNESLTHFAHVLIVLSKMAHVKLTANLNRDLEVVYFNQLDKGMKLNNAELKNVISKAIVQF